MSDLQRAESASPQLGPPVSKMALYRECDSCGMISYCPVWDGTSCGSFRSDGSRCPGHFHSVGKEV